MLLRSRPGHSTRRSRCLFEHFDTFALCALQYWYAQLLGLKREDEGDPAVRARWAIMRALKSVASLTPGTAIRLLPGLGDGNLPTGRIQDPTLWRDADVAYKRGLQLVAALRADGGKFTEPESIVGGTTVKLPWGFMSKTQYSSKFVMVRFTRRRVEDIKTLLKPMVSGLVVQGARTMQLNHVLSDKVDDVPAAKRVEATKSFKAAVRLLDGDNRPSKGRHCGRCAYLTICPSAPHWLRTRSRRKILVLAPIHRPSLVSGGPQFVTPAPFASPTFFPSDRVTPIEKV